MEAAGMLLRRRRRMKARAGEVDSPKKKMNEEEEEEGEEEEEEEEEEKEEGEEKEEEEQKDEEEEEEEANEEPEKSSKDDGKSSKEDLKHHLQAQVLQLLDELEETREMVLKHEEDALELQGLLEDERLASAHQAEIFTKQIQRLQAQMHTRKDEFESLQETKDAELGQVAQDLQEANEAIRNLHLEAEEAAAVHENEIASLQEELCRKKAELEKVQRLNNEYEMELTALRAEMRMIQDTEPEITVAVIEPPCREPRLASPSQEIARLQGELDTARGQYTDLREEFQTLQASNKLMVHQLEKLEAMKYKYRSKTEESPSLESISQWPTDRRYSLMKQPANQKGSCVSFWSVEIVGVASDYNEEERMEKVEEENELDLSHQLAEEEEKVEKVQNQSNVSQCTLGEMENEDQAYCQDIDFRRRHRRRRDSDVRKGIILAHFNMPETEREDHSSSQEPINNRRFKRRISLREGIEDDLKSWRERERNAEFRPDQELNRSSEREGQGFEAQSSVPDMEREDQSSIQDPDNERRPRREPSSDQEPDESPGREGQRDRAQQDLRELEERYRHSQYEWEQLQEELHLCREEIERLNGTIPIEDGSPTEG